jgi:hypothetical protein
MCRGLLMLQVILPLFSRTGSHRNLNTLAYQRQGSRSQHSQVRQRKIIILKQHQDLYKPSLCTASETKFLSYSLTKYSVSRLKRAWSPGPKLQEHLQQHCRNFPISTNRGIEATDQRSSPALLIERGYQSRAASYLMYRLPRSP